MLTQIELNPSHAAELSRLEQSTGESRSALLGQALENFFEYKHEYAELLADVKQSEAEIEAGEYYSTAEVMANAMTTIANVQSRKLSK